MKSIIRILAASYLASTLSVVAWSQTLGQVLRATQNRQQLLVDRCGVYNSIGGSSPVSVNLISWNSGLGAIFPTDSQLDPLAFDQKVSLLRQAWNRVAIQDRLINLDPYAYTVATAYPDDDIFEELGGPISCINYFRALQLLAHYLKKPFQIEWPITAGYQPPPFIGNIYGADDMFVSPIPLSSSTYSGDGGYVPYQSASLYNDEDLTDILGCQAFGFPSDGEKVYTCETGWQYPANLYTYGSPTFSGTIMIQEASHYAINGASGLLLPSTNQGDGTPDSLYQPGYQLWESIAIPAASGSTSVPDLAGPVSTGSTSFPGVWIDTDTLYPTYIPDVSQHSEQSNQSLESYWNAIGQVGNIMEFEVTYVANCGEELAQLPQAPPEAMPRLAIRPDFKENRLEVRLANEPTNECVLYWTLTSDTTQSLAQHHMLNVRGYGNWDAVYSGKPADRETEYIWQGDALYDANKRWPTFWDYLNEWWQPVLTQLATATYGINVVENQGATPATSTYSIEFYRADAIVYPKTNGTYSFSGDPIETWTISNPSGDDSQGGLMEIQTPAGSYCLTGTNFNSTQTWMLTGTSSSGAAFLQRTWSLAGSTSTECNIIDGQVLPTVVTNWYAFPAYPTQIADGVHTTSFAYQSGTYSEANTFIADISSISQTGGARPFTATNEDNDVLTGYLFGSASSGWSYGTAVTQTDTFNGATVRTLTTNYSNDLTEATATVQGIADITGTTVLYSGSDGTNPWAPEMVAGLDGMVTTYNYAWSGSNFVTTVARGPGASLVSGDLGAGTQTVTTVNPDGKIISQVVTDIGSNTDLSSVTATAYGVDTSGSSIPFPSRFTCQPMNTTIGFAYDGEGTVTSATDQSGIVSSYSYDALHRPIQITRGGLTWNMGYDPGFLGVSGTVTASGVPQRTWVQQTDPFGMNQWLAVTGTENYTISRAESAGNIITTSSNETTQQYSTDVVDKTSLAESVTGNATEPWGSSFAVSSGGGWAITATDGNDSSVTTETSYDSLGRMIAQSTPDPGGYGTSVSTTVAYSNGFESSITDPLDTTNYSYQPDGSVQTVSRGARSITINRNNGNLSWNCTNALGETLWTKTYDSTSGATTFMPFGQSAQEVITTPSITGNLLNITRVDPFSTTNNSWQDGAPYGMSYSGFGMASNGSTSINPYGEVTQSTVNPGSNSANAIMTTFSLPGLPSGISSSLFSATIGNSFDPNAGLTQTVTQNSHTNTQNVSPEGLWMGGNTAYGQPFQTWGGLGYSGNNITRSLTTGAGSVNMTFGPTGLLVNRAFPDGSSESFTHNADGVVSTWTGPNGTMNFAPNEYGEATESGTYGTIGHDNAGQVNAISDAAGSCTISHTFGKISTVSYTSGILNGDTITHGFYPNGLLESVSLPGGKTIGYSYNGDGSLNTITTVAGVTGTYSSYCAVNGRAQNISIGSATVTGSFDGLGRNTSQSSVADGMTWGYSHQYDADGHCNYANTPQGSWTYTYDSYGFIHSAVGGGRTLNYSFDSAGRPANVGSDYYPTALVNSGTVNVVGSVTLGAGVTINGTAATVNGTTGQFAKTYTPTPNTWQTYIVTGSLTASGTTSTTQQINTVYVPPLSESLGYNAAGDLGDDARWSYGWNGLDQLVTISDTNPYTKATATRINCVYDLQGRRVQKTVSIGGKVSKVTTTLWDAWRPVMETDYSGTTGTVTAQRWYTWGPDVSGDIDGDAGIGGLIEIMEKEGNATIVSLPIYDGIGNIVGLVDETTGVQVASYTYGPFGELLAEYGPRANMCPFRFQTKLYDPETGYYYFGKRYYNPKTQTWISRDPIREDGGVNLYAYCEDQPIGNFDPIGEAPELFPSDDINDVARINPLTGQPEARYGDWTGAWSWLTDNRSYSWQTPNSGDLARLFTQDGCGLYHVNTDPNSRIAISNNQSAKPFAAIPEQVTKGLETEAMMSAAGTAGILTGGAAFSFLTANGAGGFFAVAGASMVGGASGDIALQSQEIAAGDRHSLDLNQTANSAAFSLVLGVAGYGISEGMGGLLSSDLNTPNPIGAADTGGDLTNVFRVEGAPNTRLMIDEGGNVSIHGDNTLFLNFGDEARAQEFLARRIDQGMEGATLKQFQVPMSYVDQLRSSSVLESEVHLFPEAPIRVDTAYPDQFGLRQQHFDELLNNIVPGSGQN